MNLKFFSLPAPSPMIREFFPRDLVIMVCAALVFLLAGALYCFADDGTGVVAATTTTTLFSYLKSVENYVEAFSVAVGCILALVAGGRIIVQIIGLLNITDANQKAALEDKWRKVLHDAAENGLKFAFAKAGVPASFTPAASVIADAVSYVQDKNPEALDFFNVSGEQLEHIITTKRPDIVPWLRSIAADEAKPADAVPTPPAPALVVGAPVAG